MSEITSKQIDQLPSAESIGADDLFVIQQSSVAKKLPGSALVTLLGGKAVTQEVKVALLACFQNVAWATNDGQSYYDALSAALNLKELVSISAVFAPGQNTIYVTDSLDSLKQYLTVTALYDDATTSTVSSSFYTLSGTLAVGTNTITVTYGEATTTFTVTAVEKYWLYHFDNTLASSGTADFGWTGSMTYETGFDGTGYSYKNDPNVISATEYDVPDFSGDFTVSYWTKTLVAGSGQGFCAYVVGTSTADLPAIGTATNVKSGWTVTDNGVNAKVQGIRLGHFTSSGIANRFVNSTDTKGSNFLCVYPNTFDTTAWHHYAWTRKNNTVRFFVDGEIIFTFTTSDAILFNTQTTLGGWYDNNTAASYPTNKSCYDDLYIAESCKWDDEFDPTTITY